MGRPITPKYYYTYEVQVKGIGTTEEMADFNLEAAIKYHSKWIRGTLLDDYKKYGSYSDGVHTKYARLTFQNEKYFRGE